MQGLEMLTARGILTKINSVMIPGDQRRAPDRGQPLGQERGAFLHNVMPLISDPDHGTHYGLIGQRGPSAMELKALQDRLEGGAKLMRHCRQCRADAVGLLGEDRGQEFTLDQLPEAVDYDPAKRTAYREFVAVERDDHVAAKQAAAAAIQEAAVEGQSMLVAVATKGGGRVNEHFGHAKEFQIYEASPKGVVFVGHRKVDAYCMGGFGEDATLDAVMAALEGVRHVLCAKIGDCPKDMLEAAGIEASDAYAYEYSETAIGALYAETFASAPGRAVA